MKKSILFPSFFLILLILFSCSKEETPPTSKELLTATPWIIKSKIIDPPFSQGGITVSDITVMDSEEVKKYSYNFNADGTMELKNQLNESLFNTSWAFNADETEILFTPGIVYSYPIVGDISLGSFNIDLISANQIISTNQYSYEDTNYTIKITFFPK